MHDAVLVELRGRRPSRAHQVGLSLAAGHAAGRAAKRRRLSAGGLSERAAICSACNATTEWKSADDEEFPNVAPSLGVPDATDEWGAEEIAKLKQKVEANAGDGLQHKHR